MPEKITTRTYRGDLPQFRVMLHCLNKNWQGERHISIACTKNWDQPDSDIINLVKPMAEEILNGWTVEYVPQFQTSMVGYEEAQLYNFTMARDDRFEDSIAIDSKDFLLKPCSMSDFKVGDQYKITRFRDSQNRTFSEFYREFCDDIGIDYLDAPLPLILTPYVFNREQTKRIWNRLLKEFGENFQEWCRFPTGVEWCVYYAYTLLDPNKIVEFVPINGPYGYWMPIGGIFKYPDVNEALRQEADFDLHADRKFWKHHRSATTKETAEITARVLANHDINNSIIDRWLSEISDNLRS